MSIRRRNIRNRQRGLEGEKRVYELLSKYGQCQHLGLRDEPDLIFKGVQIEVKTIKPRSKRRVGRIKIDKDAWQEMTKNGIVWLIVEVRTRPKKYYLIDGDKITRLIAPKRRWLSLTVNQIRRMSLNGDKHISAYVKRIG